MKKTPLVLISALAVLSACGGSKSGSSKLKATVPETAPVVVVAPDLDIDAGLEGQYLAVFNTINLKVTGKLTGAFTFSREKEVDELVGDVRLTNAGPNLLHSQYVRLGSRCPIPEDDTNKDGHIDAAEGEAVYGKVFFPLDGDLTSQSSHDGEFPVGDVYGNYIYSKVTLFSTFISDMRSAQANDGYHKLKDREPLNIEGKVVVVHGVDMAAELPATVGTINRIVPYQTLPIACGVIKKVMTPPGRIDNGTYPDPTVARPVATEPPIIQPPVVVQPPVVEQPPTPAHPEPEVQPEAPVQPEVSAEAPTEETQPAEPQTSETTPEVHP